MTTVKRITDLTKYTSVLPYDSEMFGVYQPLLGWKSVRIANRFKDGFHRDKAGILDRLKREFSGQVEIAYDENNQVSIKMKPGAANALGSLAPFRARIKVPILDCGEGCS
jgi:hypothetical protein